MCIRDSSTNTANLHCAVTRCDNRLNNNTAFTLNFFGLLRRRVWLRLLTYVCHRRGAHNDNSTRWLVEATAATRGWSYHVHNTNDTASNIATTTADDDDSVNHSLADGWTKQQQIIPPSQRRSTKCLMSQLTLKQKTADSKRKQTQTADTNG